MASNTPLQTPESWQRARLQDIADKIKTGGTPRSSDKSYYNGSLPFVMIDDMTSSGKFVSQTTKHISDLGLQNSSAWIVPKDSLLYSIYATVGEVSINLIDVATNQAIAAIIPNQRKVDREYLYYFLVSIKPSLRRFFKETTQKNLTSEIVRDLEVILPPLVEQKEIALILRTVDEGIAKTDDIIAATEKLKRGLMQELFTRGVDHVEFRSTKVGKIPETWTVARYGDVTSITTGKKDANAQVKSGAYPFFTCAKEVSNIDVFSFDMEAVLVAGNGDFNVKYYSGKFDAYQRTYVIRAGEGIDGKFLYFLTLFALPQITAGARGSTIKYLKIGDFTEFLFGLPPVSEQKKIVGVLSALDEKLALEKRQRETLARLKSGLTQDLLSGKVRTINK